jgi:hypothetical protein
MRVWKRIRWQLPGIVTALLSASLSIFGKEIKEILEKALGIVGGPFFWVIVAAVAALVFFLISRALRLAPLRTLRKEEQPPQMPGLILLVGPGRRQTSPTETAAEPAIEYHRLDKGGTPVLRVCWLVTSKEGFDYAVQLREHYQRQGIKIPEPFKVQDAFDVRESFELVSRIYNEELSKEGLGESQVLADLTGATKPMTIGMALACTVNNRNLPMQYMLGGGYGAPYKTEAMLIKFDAPTD